MNEKAYTVQKCSGGSRHTTEQYGYFVLWRFFQEKPKRNVALIY
jgi:hypothetical protein